MTTKANYIVATIKPWNIEAFRKYSTSLPGNWHLITEPSKLSKELLTELSPEYIFFPHWSWIVPEEILAAFTCVCFHMTDLPYGRGGSPLQNLIVRGHKTTKLTALRMTPELDAGPIYTKVPLSLEGSAQQIFSRQADIVYDVIRFIVETRPEPIEQQGSSTSFTRRTPAESALPLQASADQLYDHIRMLDAETYPKAFVEQEGYVVEFADAKLESGLLTATASFRFKKQEP